MYEPRWHPLQKVDNFTPLQYWDEFLCAWEHNRHPEVFLTLLDAGFRLNMTRYGREDRVKYRDVDRLAFYLEVAEGHYANLTSFSMEGDGQDVAVYADDGRRTHRSIDDFRREVAQKAFKILCRQLSFISAFEVGSSCRVNPEWKAVITSPTLYPTLQGFLRAEANVRRGRIEFPNLPYRFLSGDEFPEEREWLWSFISNLAEFVWVRSRSRNDITPSKEPELTLHKKWTQSLDDSKPWLVKLFLGFEQELALRQWFPLDNPCLKLLTEVAMTNAIDWPGVNHYSDRPVRNLVEAVYSGSRAARLLETHANFMRIERLKASDAKKLRKESAERALKVEREKARQDAQAAKAKAKALGVKV